MQSIYLGRQPILNTDEALDSYEALYPQGDSAESYAQNDFRSAMVIGAILNKFGAREILGGRRAFVKIGEKFILSDIIFTIPNEFFIFSLLDEVPMSNRVVERLRQLKSRGYVLSIDELVLDENSLLKYKYTWQEFSYVKINIHADFINSKGTKDIIKEIKSKGIKVVGTKIEDEKRYEVAKKLGCELFQGYFFSRPKIFENEKYYSSQTDILRLYTLLMEDTNIDEIAAEFEKNHPITLQLLCYINSGIFHFKNKISSIHHALVLVGRAPLAEWLMFMIYAKAVSKSNKISPLMLTLKNRTELMQIVLKRVSPDVRSNMLGQAYFVGVLSLIDAIFGRKLETILDEMNVDETVRDAVLYDKGILGEIYALVRDIEQFEAKKVAAFEKKHNLAKSSFRDLMLEGIKQRAVFE